MTEKDYINATDLNKIRNVNSILNGICIDNQPNIPIEEFNLVRSKLINWAGSITKQITVEEE